MMAIAHVPFGNVCSKALINTRVYFDSHMSRITNTVVYFDWKTVIYIYVCRKCRTPFMLPMEKLLTLTGK
jgi:hypothetical protein